MYRVLLIEDEDIIRQGIRQAIPWEEWDCTVVGEARNGVEGKAQIEALQPHIVIVDLNMPILGGLEMIEATRENHSYVAIVLTGYAEFSMAQAAIRCGVFEYLLKPLDPASLIESLKRATKRCKQEAREQEAHPAERAEEAESPLYHLVNQEPTDPIVQAILQYISTHYREKIAIANLVEALHYSDRYISQKFQKAFGTTVIDYLTRYRIQCALTLLREDSLPITDIGYACGMGEYKYFSHVFKKYMHCSPKKYRGRKR